MSAEKTTFEIWLEFEHWLPQDGDSLDSDAFNMQITLCNGKKYALNVWTFQFVSTVLQKCRETGECLSGEYLPAPDLFVEQLDRAAIERIVTDMIRHGELKSEWEIRDSSDDR